MPCLIPEILFAIGKKVIEDGDSDAVIRFTVSGKESLRAMKNVFASVTSLELYRDGYAIGWSNGCTKFELQDDKPFCKFLMDQIGNRVETLHLDIDGINRMYQTVLDKIMSHPRVITLSVGSKCSRFLLEKFFHAVSSSLKNVTIPSSMMNKTFRDSLNLDSLIVLDSNGFDYFSFCCKTKSVELSNFREDVNVFAVHEAIATVPPISPHLSTVKKLIFNTTTDSYFPYFAIRTIENPFPALEVIQYNHGSSDNVQVTMHEMSGCIEFFQNIFEKDVARSPKFACKFYKCNRNMDFPSLEWCENLFCYFPSYDETNQKFNDAEMKDFHCFRLNIPSKVDESRTTTFEIQVAK